MGKLTRVILKSLLPIVSALTISWQIQNDELPLKWVSVYFESVDKTARSIEKAHIPQLISEGLKIDQDTSIANAYIYSYDLNLGVRKLYEDSIGKSVILTDYFSETVYDNKPSPFYLEFIETDVKRGDTIYFENIIIRDAKASKKFTLKGKPLKYIIK